VHLIFSSTTELPCILVCFINLLLDSLAQFPVVTLVSNQSFARSSLVCEDPEMSTLNYACTLFRWRRPSVRARAIVIKFGDDSIQSTRKTLINTLARSRRKGRKARIPRARVNYRLGDLQIRAKISRAPVTIAIQLDRPPRAWTREKEWNDIEKLTISESGCRDDRSH